MAKTTLKVYLDHLIKRDDLLYKRAVNNSEQNTKSVNYLTIKDLSTPEESMAEQLRKPDFQRATYAWTPIECVDLLEAVLTDQVVPSVILWRSPDTDVYVLDGGHRISVLLAWIKDDWGNNLPATHDYSLDFVEAAKEVRKLLDARGIGSFKSWQEASKRYKSLIEKDEVPEISMAPSDIEHAKQYNRWKTSDMGFPILWVIGDYEKAEDSFLKINKTGRRLSEWETKLVENRQSSFARAIMSIANKNSATYCWGNRDAKTDKTDKELAVKVEEIIGKVKQLDNLLFSPTYVVPIANAKQPLLAIHELQPENRPAYVAELLTIISGKKGKKSETEALLKEDKTQSSQGIVNKGLKILDEAIDVISNIYAQSPRSMTLMPLVYFYNVEGRYVRSLLYGMIYWIASGTDEEIMHRKLLFTVYRASFEDVLLNDKMSIIRRIGRRIGSGSEVTYITAKYFNHLLELIIENKGDIKSSDFSVKYDHLLRTLGNDSEGTVDVVPDRVSANRVFVGTQRQAVRTRDFLTSFQSCGICGGRYYPGLYVEIDHVTPHAKGGETRSSNGRQVHPFCNNNRERIEALKDGSDILTLPTFVDPSLLPKPQQLKLFSLSDFDEEITEEVDD